MSEFNSCLRSGKVSFGCDFSSVAEVTYLFGSTATKLPYHNWFKIPGKDKIIGCLLFEDGGEGWTNKRKIGPVCDGRGWNEVLAIDEFNKDAKKTQDRIKGELERPLTRYVFWREERAGAKWYKFYGAFEIDADFTRATLESENPRVVYRRKSTEAECLKVDVVKTVFSDDEFNALAGKTVEFDFWDELAVLEDEKAEKKDAKKKENSSTVSVMPGARFVVEQTDSRFACVVGNVERKRGARFLIPRRDFELGYLHVLR